MKYYITWIVALVTALAVTAVIVELPSSAPVTSSGSDDSSMKTLKIE